MKPKNYLILVLLVVLASSMVIGENWLYDDMSSVNANWTDQGDADAYLNINSTFSINGSALEFNNKGTTYSTSRWINNSGGFNTFNVSFSWRPNTVGGAGSMYVGVGNWSDKAFVAAGASRGGVSIQSHNGDNFLKEATCGNFAGWGSRDAEEIWVNFTLMFNTSSGSTTNSLVTIFVNGSVGATNCDFFGNVPMTELKWIHVTSSTDVGDLAYIDELHVYNKTEPAAPPFFSNDTINMSDPSPINNTQFAFTSVNFNLTVNSSFAFNATLFINGSSVNTTEFSGGTDVYVEFNYTFTSGAAYLWHINATDNNTGENTTDRFLYIDDVNPGLATSFLNHSVFLIKNITTQFNFSDNFLLFSYNLSIDDAEVNGLLNLGTANYNLNWSYNTTNLTNGYHSLTVRFADGHTAKRLGGNYGVSDGLFNNYLRYQFWDKGYVKIKPKDSSIFDSFGTKRLMDRYTFSYEPNKKKTEHVFEVTSDEEIHIINTNSKYKNYLIMGDHWLDFVLEDSPESTVQINRVNANKVLVNVSNILGTDKLNFNSLGDLNVITQVFNFTKVNFSESSPNNGIVNERKEFVLEINTSGAVTETSVNLFFNNSEQTVTKTSFGGYDRFTSSVVIPALDNTSALSQDVTYYWEYLVNGSTGTNESGNLTYDFTMSNSIIDNCSTYSMRAMNITLLREKNNSIVAGTIGGYFEIWNAVRDNFIPFNLTWGHNVNNTPVGVCIYPNTSSYTFYSQIEYQDLNAEFEKKRYYFYNSTLNNQTQLLDLYLTNGTTQVKFNVRDFDDNVVGGAIIKVLSFDVDTNSFTTTEILKTDTDGAAFGEIILNTQFYQFIVEFNGIIYLQTLPTIITTTEKTFRIELDTDYFARYTEARDMVGYVTFNNATQNFAFTWSDPSGTFQQGCLKVLQSSVQGQSTFNETCVTSTASTIIINIGVGTSLNTTNTFIGVGYIIFSDGEKFVLGTDSISFDYVYRQFGKSGLFVGFLLILTLFLVGIRHPVVSVVLGTIGVFGLIVMKIMSLTWGGVTVLAILSGIVIYRLSKK